MVEIGGWKGAAPTAWRKVSPGAWSTPSTPSTLPASGQRPHLPEAAKGETPLLARFEQRMTALGRHGANQTAGRLFPTSLWAQIPHIDFLFLDGDHSVAALPPTLSSIRPTWPRRLSGPARLWVDKAEMGPCGL